MVYIIVVFVERYLVSFGSSLTIVYKILYIKIVSLESVPSAVLYWPHSYPEGMNDVRFVESVL